MKEGFVTVASAIPSVRVADVEYNVENIKKQIAEAEAKGVEMVVFPELCVTSYSCQDLFTQQLLTTQAEQGVKSLLEWSKDMDVISIVGVPVEVGNLLLNCAAVLHHGVVKGLVIKEYLPNYGEFYEKRWFASSQDFNGGCIDYAGTLGISVVPGVQLFETADHLRFGIEICEDVWAPVPPSNHLALAGADLVFNLSASDELLGKHQYLKSLLAQQSARTICGYVYSGCGFGESTQDVVYGGNALIYENGSLLAESPRFAMEPQLLISEIDVDRLRSERRRNSTFINAQRREKASMAVSLEAPRKEASPLPVLTYRDVDPRPFIPKGEDMQHSCEEIFNIQLMALAKRLVHTHSQKVVVGISGGLDSTQALLVCVKTFDKLGYDRKGIIGVTMPGFGTTDRTYHNALSLMQSLGITIREISIAKSVIQHFEDIGHDMNVHDVTYENSQARERTQILMDLSNQCGGLVIGTGDLSELALGWATYNGDHMSMYGINASVPKTLIQYLVKYVANNGVDEASRKTLLDIVDTPISPELTPADEHGQIAQKTEDLVGPYELHDFFLYYFLRFGFGPSRVFLLARRAFSQETYDDSTLKKWLKIFLRRFFAQQFKRSCLPDGPKVGSVSLSPRGDWRMPSDASCAIWLNEVESL
jgi:NAD+ synthase (glutamine-hydrolysing)